MVVIKYTSGPRSALTYLGRNRYGKQAGIVLADHSREGERVLRFHPITTRNTLSDACHMEVPATAAPELARAILKWAEGAESESSRTP